MKKILLAVLSAALLMLWVFACGRQDARRWGNAVIESVAYERAPSFEQFMETISANDKEYEIARLTICFRWADKSKGLVLEGPELCLRDEQGGHYLMNASRIEFSLPKGARIGSMGDRDTMTLFFAVRKNVKLTSLEWRHASLPIPFK